MIVKDLLELLRSQGHDIRLSGEKLLFTPAPSTTKGERETALGLLKLRKQEILAYLVASEGRFTAPPSELAPCGDPNCKGCYEIGPNVHIHPPKGRAL